VEKDITMARVQISNFHNFAAFSSYHSSVPSHTHSYLHSVLQTPTRDTDTESIKGSQRHKTPANHLLTAI